MNELSNRPVRLQSALRIWERNLRTYREKWYYSIVPHFFEPVFYLLGIGLGLGTYVAAGGDFEQGYVVFIAPGLIAASAMNGAAFETTYNVYVKLVFRQIYDAMIATRISMKDVIVGELLWATTRSFIYGFIFMVITFFFGVPLIPEMLLAPVAILLTGFCFAAIGLAFTSFIHTIDFYTYYFTLFITPMFLFSDIFFPVADRFPDFLVWIAHATPLFHGVQLMRGCATGDLSPWLISAPYLLIVGSLLAVFAVQKMHRRVVY